MFDRLNHHSGRGMLRRTTRSVGGRDKHERQPVGAVGLRSARPRQRQGVLVPLSAAAATAAAAPTAAAAAAPAECRQRAADGGAAAVDAVVASGAHRDGARAQLEAPKLRRDATPPET